MNLPWNCALFAILAIAQHSATGQVVDQNLQFPTARATNNQQIQLQQTVQETAGPNAANDKGGVSWQMTMPQFNPQSPQFTQVPLQNQAPQGIDSQRYQQIVSGSERFALDLFARTSVGVESFNYNFILSPFSVWSLLVLTAEGARGNTLNELQRVLGIADEFIYTRQIYRQIQDALTVNTSSVELQTTQVLYSDRNRPIDLEYERTIDTYYKTEQVPIDFLDVQNSLITINRHIDQLTRGRISKLLTEDDLKDATLILASAIFFKGTWKVPFNRSLTTEQPFLDEQGNEVEKVNMMFKRGAFPYTAIAELDSHILELPYGNDSRLSMIILLPRKNVTLSSVTRRLSEIRLQRVYDELKKSAIEFEDDEVEVFLPRFSITADFVLNEVLEQMGILDLFSPSLADLTKITTSPVYLSRLVHKAKIEVNEEGTVASAATAGTFANKATPPRFYANRPFAYLIVDKISNVLLFCGQVKNPKKFRI